MPSQWLSTSVYRVTNRGTGNTRTIIQSGTDTSVLDSPVKTVTTTRNAVPVQTVTNEDVGAIVAFSVIVEGGLGTVPAGDTPSDPICGG